MLSTNNLPAPERFFGGYAESDKLNMVILPVFFHRADGACMARRRWETAVELNPQLGRNLRFLAVSPKVVPMMVGYRRNCSAEGRRSLTEAILHITSAPRGQQIVALYQSQGFILRSNSAMTGTLEMLRQYERVLARLPANSRKGQL